jgi:hypothetical protein
LNKKIADVGLIHVPCPSPKSYDDPVIFHRDFYFIVAYDCFAKSLARALDAVVVSVE